MYSSTLPSTSALDGGGWSAPCPGRFTPRKRSGTHCTGGWLAPRAGLDGCGKSSPAPGLDPRTVQPVASRYTDWAIPAARIRVCNKWISLYIVILFVVCLNWQSELHDISFMFNTWQYCNIERRSRRQQVEYFYVSAGEEGVKKFFDLEVQLIWIERQFVTSIPHGRHKCFLRYGISPPDE